MKTTQLKRLLLLIFTVLFNEFFWQENLGLNLSLFTLLVMAGSAAVYPQSWKSQNTRLSAGFTLVAALMVLIHHTIVSKIALFSSFAIFVGFLHVQEFRSVLSALAYYIQTLVASTYLSINGVLQWGRTTSIPGIHTRRSLSKLHLSVIPLVAFLVFFFIFRSANVVFSDLTDHLFDSIGTFLEHLFEHVSFLRLLFILLGVLVVVSVLYNWGFPQFLAHEKQFSDTIQRSSVRIRVRRLFKLTALKNEYTSAVWLVVSVNVLLLVVNVIDIQFLWIQFDYAQAGNLAKLVHEGTYMLILSILLSMGILLFYFRKNLNFYAHNQFLQKAAYLWIIQNSLLAFSVFLRCYYYIHQYGLAYKRIGVVVFLVLTYVGLYTLYRKISQKKSFFYLLRVNTWGVYVVLIGLSLVNWDVLIVQYNLTHTSALVDLDRSFLLTRSDKTLHILDANRSKLISQKLS